MQPQGALRTVSSWAYRPKGKGLVMAAGEERSQQSFFAKFTADDLEILRKVNRDADKQNEDTEGEKTRTSSPISTQEGNN